MLFLHLFYLLSLSLSLLSLLGVILSCEAAEIFVRPQDLPTEECPGHPCHTLNEYASNPNLRLLFAGYNTSISFLSGEHDLNQSLAVEKVDLLELAPYDDEENVRINSKFHALHEVPLLEYKEVFNVVIRNMTVDNVGISFKHSVNITLLGLTANNSQAVLMTLYNVYGTISMKGIRVNNSRQGVNLTFSMNDFNNEKQISPYTQLLLEDIDVRGTANRGVGVNISGCPIGSIVVEHSVFADLEWGFAVYPGCDNTVIFESHNLTFHRNTYGLVFAPLDSASLHTHGISEAYLRNISCFNNSVAILMNSMQNATIDNGDFIAQKVYDTLIPYKSALIVYNSVLSLKGMIKFVENIAYRGGAIALYGHSIIMLPSPQNTEVHFENNRAYDVGGALYFARSIIYTTYSVPLCAISVESASTKPVLYFSNNTAENGGNAIYGAYLDNLCVMPSGHVFSDLSDIVTNISSFYPSLADDFSVISSDAQNVCFCDHNERNKKCKSRPPSLSVYPGQVFQMLVIVYGDMGGFVKYPLSANVAPGHPGNELQRTQITSISRCSNFQYSILTNSSLAQLSFFVNTLDFLTVLNRNITLLDCPLGFKLNAMLACDCHPMLLSLGEVVCNITENSIQRRGNVWIGVLTKNWTQTQINDSNHQHQLLLSKLCRDSYCKENQVNIYTSLTQLEEDAQCSNGHSGVLCGGCLPNLSLALGSDRCIAGCSNNYLTLIVAFAVAGVALVGFINILNLTVSEGTLNGLIFYANIVGAYSALEGTSIIGGLSPFFAVFISWVNLDFGIETCFYSGMDAYTKVWLQFVFPAYLWAIGLFTIVLCHYSTRATRLFGKNGIPLLSTLVLLSYSKILQSIIAALSVATVQFLDGAKLSVWERDANIVYLSAKHVPLFLFSLSVLVLFWLPFTGILISIQWLQKYTQYRVLRWVAWLMPFFDAFTGPLKPQHRYWVGVLLLARCTLYVVFGSIYSSRVTFEYATFALTLLLVLLASVGFKYRSTYRTLLELCYIINLGLLAAGSIYISATDQSQSVLVNTSVALVFFQFTTTVIYHTWLLIKRSLKKLPTQFSVSMDMKKRVALDVDSGMNNYRKPLIKRM